MSKFASEIQPSRTLVSAAREKLGSTLSSHGLRKMSQRVRRGYAKEKDIGSKLLMPPYPYSFCASTCLALGAVAKRRSQEISDGGFVLLELRTCSRLGWSDGDFASCVGGDLIPSCFDHHDFRNESTKALAVRKVWSP